MVALVDFIDHRNSVQNSCHFFAKLRISVSERDSSPEVLCRDEIRWWWWWWDNIAFVHCPLHGPHSLLVLG